VMYCSLSASESFMRRGEPMTEYNPEVSSPQFASGEGRSAKRSEWLWAFVTAGSTAVAVVYLILTPIPFSGSSAKALSVGWNALQACGTMRSADGSREIEFHEDQTGILREAATDEDEDETSKGSEIKWEYVAKQYSITIDGAKESFSLLSVDSPGICILVKGNLASADLRGSWFASRTSTPDADAQQQ
jgi:hypothetical protein